MLLPPESGSDGGFSVIVRAFLDTGCNLSSMSTQLAALLLGAKSGCPARLQYIWPRKVGIYSGHQVTRYRTVSGLQLQSLEEGSVSTSVDLSEHRFHIREGWPFGLEETPMLSLVAPKLAALGLPLMGDSGRRRVQGKNEAAGEEATERTLVNLAKDPR